MKKLNLWNKCKYVSIAFLLLIILIVIQLSLKREGLTLDNSCNTTIENICNTNTNCIWDAKNKNCLENTKENWCVTTSQSICNSKSSCVWNQSKKECMNTSCNSIKDLKSCSVLDKCRWNFTEKSCADSYCKVIGIPNTFENINNCKKNSKCEWSWNQCFDLSCNTTNPYQCNTDHTKCFWDKTINTCVESQNENLNINKKKCFDMDNSETKCTLSGCDYRDSKCLPSSCLNMDISGCSNNKNCVWSIKQNSCVKDIRRSNCPF